MRAASILILAKQKGPTMNTAVTYGPLTFMMPDGFQDDSTIAISRPLELKGSKPADPDGYPINLTINRDKVGQAPNPLRYLEVKLQQLRSALQQFELDFVETTTISEHEAARARFDFVAHFALTQLVYVWFAGEDLLTTTLTTTAAGVEEGWRVLRQVSESITLVAV